MTPKRSPEVVLFDVMSTLVYDPYAVELPAFFDAELSELMEKKHPTAWVDFERAEIDEETFAEIFLPGVEFDYQALRETLRSSYRFLDGIEPLLGRLRHEGVEMHSLSNYPVWYELIEEELELSRFMPWDLVSWKTGHRKPEPEAYRNAARKLGYRPEECLFVDDRASNCEGARAVGMLAVQFHDAERLRDALFEFGLLDA